MIVIDGDEIINNEETVTEVVKKHDSVVMFYMYSLFHWVGRGSFTHIDKPSDMYRVIIISKYF